MRSVEHPRVDEIELATVLAALGHPVRLSLVRTLADGREHVQADFDVAVGQSTLSHHMKMLRDAGVVFSRPESTRCFVSLRSEIDQLFPGLLAAVLQGGEHNPPRPHPR